VAMLVIYIYKALWRWQFRYFIVAGATSPIAEKREKEGQWRERNNQADTTCLCAESIELTVTSLSFFFRYSRFTS